MGRQGTSLKDRVLFLYAITKCVKKKTRGVGVHDLLRKSRLAVSCTTQIRDVALSSLSLRLLPGAGRGSTRQEPRWESPPDARKASRREKRVWHPRPRKREHASVDRNQNPSFRGIRGVWHHGDAGQRQRVEPQPGTRRPPTMGPGDARARSRSSARLSPSAPRANVARKPRTTARLREEHPIRRRST